MIGLTIEGLQESVKSLAQFDDSGLQQISLSVLQKPEIAGYQDLAFEFEG